jgi:3-hydroxybutyryl-CoA dehydrogenase
MLTRLSGMMQGSWMTLMGIFRRMDFMGLTDQFEIFKTVFPKLCNDDNITPLMQHMVDIDARGTRNLLGLYRYTEEEARKWEEAFVLFNMEIFKLAEMYPSKREKKPVAEIQYL